MDLTKMKGTLSRNKVALGAVGVLAVLGLAWRARSSSTSTATDAAQSTGATTSYSTGGQTAGTSGYDSTSSDVYNAIQPQLEALQQLYSQIPVPTSDGSSSAADGYYQAAGDKGVFANKGGKLELLTFPEYQALGSPEYQVVTKSDPVWSTPTYGDYQIPWKK